MKNAKWGFSRLNPNDHDDGTPRVRVYHFFAGLDKSHRPPVVKYSDFLRLNWRADHDGLVGYLHDRANGGDEDSPKRPMLLDGAVTWDKPEAINSKICYTEGPGDKTWMEERDRNYLARLFLAGANSEQEKQDLTENREAAAKAVQEVWRLPLEQLPEVLGKLLKAAEAKTAEEKRRQETEQAKRDQKKREAEDLRQKQLEESRREAEQKAKELVEKKEASLQENRAKGEMSKAEGYASKSAAAIEAIQKTVDAAIADVKEAQSKASLVGTAEVNASCTNAVMAGAEIKRLFGTATAAAANVNAQSDAAMDAVRKAETERRANPTNVAEVKKWADSAATAAEEARKAFATIATAGGEIDKQCALVAEIKRQITVAAEQAEKEAERLRHAEEAKRAQLEQERLEREAKERAEKEARDRADKERADREAKERAEAEKLRGKGPELAIGLQLIPYRSISINYSEVLGNGGFGAVYQGEWEWTKVAVKELLASRLSVESMIEFKREAEVWGGLHHTNIVHLFGISIDVPQHYGMVMELMPKRSLYDVLHNCQPLSWEIRFHIAKDIAAGLAYLHTHKPEILHCDLKSANVLLDETMRAKLTDFGLSKVKVETRVTTAGKATGSIRWMATELVNGSGKRSKESDIYSFGMILWEIASRKLPYGDAEDEVARGLIKDGKKEEIPKECPEQHSGERSEASRRAYPSYAALIARCWEERSKRPTIQVAAEILRPLEAAAEAPPPPPPPEPAYKLMSYKPS